jgi:hypothetical protein
MPEDGTKLHKSSASLFRKSISIPEPFEHQEQTKQFGLVNPRVFDMSDAGTGKTRAWLEVLREQFKIKGGKALVLAPKTILKSAWADDIRKFTPELSYVIAYAHNRQKAFEADVDIYITNHDAVKALQKHRRDWLEDRGFHTIIVDESTAFKHRTSQRSKALGKLVELFGHRVLLTGTPNPNGLLDLWHQVFLLDGGSRLGDSYWRYRSVVCENDKDGMDLAVTELLEDITVRHIFEECTDIPENHEYTVEFELARDHRRAYEILKEHAVLELEEGGITAFNASVVARLLWRISFYNSRLERSMTTREYHSFTTQRDTSWYLISPNSETSVLLHLIGDINETTLLSSQTPEALATELSTVVSQLSGVQKLLISSKPDSSA